MRRHRKGEASNENASLVGAFIWECAIGVEGSSKIHYCARPEGEAETMMTTAIKYNFWWYPRTPSMSVITATFVLMMTKQRRKLRINENQRDG